MKKLAGTLVLLTTLIAGAQKVQKQRFGQPAPAVYSLKFHLTRCFLSINSGASYLHLIGVMGGANMELVSGPSGASFYNTGLLRPGDYPASLTAQETKKDGSIIQAYDLQLANGQHEQFTLIGLSE